MLCWKSACSVSWRPQWHTCFFVRRRRLVMVAVIPLSGPRHASQCHRSSFTGIRLRSPQKENKQTNKQKVWYFVFYVTKSCFIPLLLNSFGISLGSLSHLASLLLQASSALPQSPMPWQNDCLPSAYQI